MKLVNNICDFFSKNQFIEYNKLSNYFINNYPTTDDIFFGYFLYLNNINIKELDRINLIEDNIEFNNYNILNIKKTSHFRIKSPDSNNLIKYSLLLYIILYNE